jgi:protein-S-isoprenylcysteine O-methyltransferase Ste14
MITEGAFDSNQITKIGVGTIIALVVVGLLLSMVVSAIVGRIIILVVVVGLGVLVWQQRTSIEDHVKKCDLDMSFLGVHVSAPDDVKQDCGKISQ